MYVCMYCYKQKLSQLSKTQNNNNKENPQMLYDVTKLKYVLISHASAYTKKSREKLK
jgi:hypothetical protein